MRFIEFNQIIEQRAGEVNLAQRLKTKLSSEARHAVESWEWANWVNGDLDTAYSQKNEIHQEIERAVEPIRDLLRAREGNSITLYRGIQSDRVEPERHSDRALYSWTSRPEIAAVFSGLGTIQNDKIKLNKDKEISDEVLLSLTDANAKSIQDAMIKNGKAKWKNLFFKTSSVNDQYTDILKKVNGRFRNIADETTSSLARWLIRSREEARKYSAEIKGIGQDTGYVVKETIPIDDVVWMLNSGGSMEYIIKGHSGLNGQRIKI